MILAVLTTGAPAAWAQAALDEDPAPSSEPAPATDDAVPAEPGVTDDNAVSYGVGLRLRSVRVPQSILELFLERAAGGASNIGVGVEFTRRRGTVELQLGFEFEHLTVQEGVWINKGENVAAGDEADYILSPDRAPDGEKLGWFTIEFTFLNHAEINKYVSIRYGGGAGLGILTGGLYRYDVSCNGATNAMPEPGCRPAQVNGGAGTGRGPVKYDLPPVFPVVNAIIGAQFKPMDKLVINVEGGLRTVPFFGVTTAYFF